MYRKLYSTLNTLEYREVEAIEILVENNRNSSILSARDEWGYTPAHWAALDGNLEVCENGNLSSL